MLIFYIHQYWILVENILKILKKILKKYQKIVPYVFDLGGRAELHSENFDAKRTAKIIVEILYLKKDELDKVDGGLPVI